MLQKIVYLKPRSGFKTLLASDTLFNMLCWGVHLMEGQAALEMLLAQFKEGQPPFRISSAFPYQTVQGERVPYFPMPMRFLDSSDNKGSNFYERRIYQRFLKTSKEQRLLPKAVFEVQINGKGDTHQKGESYAKAPKVQTEAITHNSIDRLTGSTLDSPQGGKLYHVEENFLQGDAEEIGLYFLMCSADASILNRLEAVLRLMAHLGMGGNRSIGSGRFEVDIQDFQLQEPDQANAITNLSLYHPTTQELAAYENCNNERLLLYKIEERQGYAGFLTADNQAKKAYRFFKEASVFPFDAQFQYGKILEVGSTTHHPLYHYGYGYMVKIKVTT